MGGFAGKLTWRVLIGTHRINPFSNENRKTSVLVKTLDLRFMKMGNFKHWRQSSA